VAAAEHAEQRRDVTFQRPGEQAMYAIVRETTYDPAALDRGENRVAEFQTLHARQPGYAGTVIVEIGPGRWLSVNLWESEDDASAALPVMRSVVARLLEPMMTAPSKTLGAGRVVLTDLHKD
jgi:hypothetical protein